ncbi:MAG: hypothetical protein M3R44_03365, partial [Candidatus Eremiobacteraeota bacterium]|nr:hypothetical protein [Candidatus Eremiobacteraeota bacterium]
AAYCTHQPCVHCAKLLTSAGIVRIVFAQPYPDTFAQELLAEAGVAFVPFTNLENTKALGARDLRTGTLS